MDSETFIGWITLQKENDEPDIGISLIPEARGKGYGAEAVSLYGNYLHKQYGLPAVFMRTNVENTAANRMIQRIGGDLISVEPFGPYHELMKKVHGDDFEDMMLNYYRIDLPIGGTQNDTTRPSA